MILNLQVDISDEVLKLFWGYSLYKYNEKKSLEAKALFEELFNTLQSELEKEYQSTEQRLQGLDKRLKVLEMYSADAREVDRAISNLNNRVARIDSDLKEYERQQKDIANLAAQLENSIGQIYDAIIKDVESRQNSFATKLETEVNNQVKKLLTRILADNLDETIRTAVDTVVKDYDFQKPDYSAAIKSEVANAFKNIFGQNFNAFIQAKIAEAVRLELQKSKAESRPLTISTQSYFAKIDQQYESINAQEKSIKELQELVKSLTARLSAVEGKSFAPQVSSRPLTVSDYSYIAKIDKQRETIDAQEKSIKELQELVRNLTARLSAVEGKFFAPQVSSRPLTVSDYLPQAETVLNVRDKNSLQKYKDRLLDIGELKNFAKNNPDTFRTLAARLDRIKKAVDKIDPQEFDEYTTEFVVDKTVGIAKEFMDLLSACNRTIKNPNKDSTAARKLYNLIEEYLARLGIRPMEFKAGGDYEEWADLGMSELPMRENTGDRRKHNTLKEINVQPHFIYYLDEHDKKARRVFGGQCVVYVYKN